MDIGSLTGQVSIEDQLSDKMELMIHHVKHFADEFEGMAGTLVLGGAAIVAAVTGIVISIVELGESGSKILGVENAFDRLAEAAGTTGDALRGALSDGVKGTVDSMTLMQSTMRLMSSGMKLTTEQATLMGEASRALGKATGGDAASGLNTLSTALITGRVRGLQQQIGLIDLTAGEKKFADSIGVTVGQLNEAGKLEGKRIAILDATKAYVERLGISELSFAERIKQGEVAITEWKDSLEKAVASSVDVNDALKAIGDAISEAFGAGKKSLLDYIIAGINSFARAVTATVPYIVSFFSAIKSAWDFLAQFKEEFKLAAYAIAAYTAEVVLASAAQEAWTVAVTAFEAVTGAGTVFTTMLATINPVTLAMTAVAVAVAVLGTKYLELRDNSKALSDASNVLSKSILDVGVARSVLTAFEAGKRGEQLKDIAVTLDMAEAYHKGQVAMEGQTKASDEARKSAEAMAKFQKTGVLQFPGFGPRETEKPTGPNAADFTKDEFKPKVEAMAKSWADAGLSARVFTAAFAGLSQAQLDNYDVQKMLLPEILKLNEAGKPIPEAMRIEASAIEDSDLALRTKGFNLLAANNITLDYINHLKGMGLSETEVALALGVTNTALKARTGYLEDMKRVSTVTPLTALPGTMVDTGIVPYMKMLDERKKLDNEAEASHEKIAQAGFDYDIALAQHDISSHRTTLTQKLAATGDYYQLLHDKATDSYNYERGQIIKSTSAQLLAIDKTVYGWQTLEASIKAAGDASLNALDTNNGVTQLKIDLDKAAAAADTLKETLMKTFQSIPQTLISAFEGGGGLLGALKSIAVQFGQDFGKSMSDAIAKQLNESNWGISGGGYTGAAISGKTAGLALASGLLAGGAAAASGASTGKQIGAVASAGANIGMMAYASGATIAGSAALAAYTAGAGLALVAAVKIYKAMNDGRKAMQDYYKTFQGGSDELRKKMLALGDAGEVMWKKLTQQTGKGDKAGAQALITQINTALANSPQAFAEANYQTRDDLQKVADKAKAVYDYMVSSGKYTATAITDAFQKSKDATIAAMSDEGKAHADAMDAITAKYATMFSAIDSEYKTLSQSVGAEAEEAVMGATEIQERARMKQLEGDRAALEEKQKNEETTAQETYDGWVEAGKEADRRLRELFQKPYEIPIHWVPSDLPGSEQPVHMATGGVVPFSPSGTDTVPAMLTPGETVIPAGRAQTPIVIPITVRAGNEVIAKQVVKTFIQAGL